MNFQEQLKAIDTTLLAALPAAIYVTDAEGRITYYNPAAAEFWGVEPEIGTAKWCGSWRLYWPDGTPLPHDECPMAMTLKTGEPVRGVEAIAERPDGTRLRFLPYPTPLRDASGTLIGAVNLLMDITELHEAEADSQRLASIVTSSDDAIISKTLDGRVTFWNAGATRIFGYEEDEMIGEKITKIIPPELHEEEKYVLARLQHGERIDHYETVRVTKDGRRVNISLTVSPLRERSGRVVGASKVARDITERKQIESSRMLLMGELSHRVKNTLATVQAIATQSLRRARNPADFVTSFTGRIHSLARAHDLLSEAKWEGIELNALVRDQVLLGVADDRITSGGPGLALAAQPSLHLAMVLHELGTNARKYGALSTPQGRLAIAWQVVGTKDGRELRLQWSESGGPAVVAPAERGFGTRLIEDSLLAHGGEASIEYGARGLSCELRLPLPEPKQESGAYRIPQTAQSAEDSIHRARLQGKRVLVVEDETLIAMEIEAALRDGGCEVLGPAGDIEEATRLITAERCDAALLDANLNGRRVDAVAAALTREGVPFAFITGYGADALPEPFRDAMIIPKPFNKHQLLSALAVLLQRRPDTTVHHLGAVRAKR